MEQPTYLKVPFVWEEPQPRIEVPTRLRFQPAGSLNHETLVSLVAQVMASSVDPSIQKQLADQDSYQAVEQFLFEAREGFAYQVDWWQVGLNTANDFVGFVLPVIYEGCDRDGLEEATIYFIGVLPQHQGSQFGTDLLLKGTRILQDVGIWRVFCDTAVNNAAMISTFQRVGYQQCGEPYARPL